MCRAFTFLVTSMMLATDKSRKGTLHFESRKTIWLLFYFEVLYQISSYSPHSQGPLSLPSLAVDYLDPQYPDKATCNQASFVAIPRLLDVFSGGAYKWGTATEQKARRNAVAKASATAAASANTGQIADHIAAARAGG